MREREKERESNWELALALLFLAVGYLSQGKPVQTPDTVQPTPTQTTLVWSQPSLEQLQTLTRTRLTTPTPTLAENYTVWQPEKAKAAESAESTRPPELPADYTHVGSQVYVNPANAPVPVQCFSGQAIREMSKIPGTPIAISFRPDEPVFGRSWAYAIPATETPAYIYDPAIARGLGIAQLSGVHHIEFVQRVSSQVRPPGKLTAMVTIHELVHLGWIEVDKLPVSQHDEGVITDITNQYADSHASLPFYGILTCEK